MNRHRSPGELTTRRVNHASPVEQDGATLGSHLTTSAGETASGPPWGHARRRPRPLTRRAGPGSHLGARTTPGTKGTPMTSGMTLPDPALLARDRGITLPCQRRDGALWYPEARNAEAEDTVEEVVAYARALCTRCPLRVECLTYALGTPERYGMWGGLTEAERATLLRGKRPRNRVARELAGPTFLPRPTVPRRTVTAAAPAA